MLPSAGYFSEIDCPYFDTGGCSRPHCHFKHPKLETVVSQPLVKASLPPVKSALSQKEIGDLIKLASDAVSALQEAGVLSGTSGNDVRVVESSPIPVPVPVPITPKHVPVQQPVPTYNPTPKAVLHKLHNLAAYHPSLIRTPSAPLKRPSTSDPCNVPKKTKLLQESEKSLDVDPQHSWDKIYRLSPEPDLSNKAYPYFAPNQNNQVSSSTSPKHQVVASEETKSFLPIERGGSNSEEESAKFSEESSIEEGNNNDPNGDEDGLDGRDEDEDGDKCDGDKQEGDVDESNVHLPQGKEVIGDSFTRTSDDYIEGDKKRKRGEESDHKKGSDSGSKKSRTKHGSDSRGKSNSDSKKERHSSSKLTSDRHHKHSSDSKDKKDKHRDGYSKHKSDRHHKGTGDSKNTHSDGRSKQESNRHRKESSDSRSKHRKDQSKRESSQHHKERRKSGSDSHKKRSHPKDSSLKAEEQNTSESEESGKVTNYLEEGGSSDEAQSNDDGKKHVHSETNGSSGSEEERTETHKSNTQNKSRNREKHQSSKNHTDRRKSVDDGKKKKESQTAHKSSKHHSDGKKRTFSQETSPEQSNSEDEVQSSSNGSNNEKLSDSCKKQESNHRNRKNSSSRDHSDKHRSKSSSEVNKSDSKHKSDDKQKSKNRERSTHSHSSSKSRRLSSSSRQHDKHSRKDSSKHQSVDRKHQSTKETKSHSKRSENTKSSYENTKSKGNQESKKSYNTVSKPRDGHKERSHGVEHKRKDSTKKSSTVKKQSSSEKQGHHSKEVKIKTASKGTVMLRSPLHSDTSYSSWVSSTDELPQTLDEIINEIPAEVVNETLTPLEETCVIESSSEEEDAADDIKLPSDLGDSSCDSELERECYEIYKTYEPAVVPTKQTSETPAKEVEESQPVVVGKKRIAHKSSEKTGYSLPPVNIHVPKPKLNPKQTILDRIRQVKESQPVEAPIAPQGTNRVRIAHVANVPLLLNATSKVQKWLNHCDRNSAPAPTPTNIPPPRPALSVNVRNIKAKILPAVPHTQTIAQTAPKHGRRIAHKPPSDILVRPIIAEAGGKIPVSIRQNYLNILVDEYLKLCPTQEEAFEKAIQEELTIFNRCSTRLVYTNLMPNMISRLRKSSLNQAGTATAPQRAVSHTSVLAGMEKKPKGSWSIEKIKKAPPKSLYEELTRFIMTEEQLKSNGYPCPHSEEKGLAIFHVMPRKAVSSIDSLQRVCVRCNTTYYVNKQGLPLKKEQCIYHWGRAHQTRANGIWESQYSCCHGGSDDTGCALATCHVSETFDPKEMRGFVKTLSREEIPPDGNYGVYALDCEMCYTTIGLELTRVTVIGMDLETVYETLVKPRRPILDYNTHFSGIKEEDLKDITTSIYDVQSVLLSMFNDKTILMGHSLESDFKALKLIHSTVVDTSIVFPHRDGPPKKRALKTLCRERLRKIIQESEFGHDSAEDAKACMELMIHKIKEDKSHKA